MAGPANGSHERSPRRRPANASLPASMVRSVSVAWLVMSAISDQPGKISGLFLGNLAIVAVSILKVAATIAGGVCVSQSDRETSSKWSLLNTSRNCKSVSPGVFDVVTVAALYVADIAGIEVGGHRLGAGSEHADLRFALDEVHPLIGIGVPMQLAQCAGPQGHERRRDGL